MLNLHLTDRSHRLLHLIVCSSMTSNTPTPIPEPGRIYKEVETQLSQESFEDRWVAVNPLKATCNSVMTWHKMSQKLTQESLNSWMNFLHFCETTLIAMRCRPKTSIEGAVSPRTSKIKKK